MTDIETITVLPKLPPRPAESHKGTYGRVLVVAGSRRMLGAAALTTNAALRGGAGLVQVATPEVVQLTVAGLCPCAVSHPLPCGQDGALSHAAVADVLEMAQKATVVAIGPGLDLGQAQRDVVRAVIEHETPAVIDADGLNALTQIEGWPGLRKCAAILTPHPGEFAKLTGKSTKEVQSGRRQLAIEFARAWQGQCRHPLILVLKGDKTIVTDGRRLYVNNTGNPGMSTPGSGDVLTGLTAALVAQGLSPLDSACLGVYCHGLAGDLAAAKLGQPSVIATDLIDYLPYAIQSQIDHAAEPAAQPEHKHAPVET